MTVLKRLYSSKADKTREAILASDIIEQRPQIKDDTQQIQSPYIQRRLLTTRTGRLIIKFQYFWWVKNYRMIVMRLIAVVSWLLSILIITIEILFFFKKFVGTPLHEFLIDQTHRSYFSQTVSCLPPF